jgi:cytochrome c oxidase subunit IV
MSQPVEQVEPGEAEELSHHPEPRQYVVVAVILAIVTAAEVAIYYISALQDLIVPFLIAFALIKFILVALWFMHLRFDSRLFRRLFVTGILLAMAIFAVVLVFFATHGGPAPGVSS